MLFGELLLFCLGFVWKLTALGIHKKEILCYFSPSWKRFCDLGRKERRELFWVSQKVPKAWATVGEDKEGEEEETYFQLKILCGSGRRLWTSDKSISFRKQGWLHRKQSSGHVSLRWFLSSFSFPLIMTHTAITFTELLSDPDSSGSAGQSAETKVREDCYRRSSRAHGERASKRNTPEPPRHS